MLIVFFTLGRQFLIPPGYDKPNLFPNTTISYSYNSPYSNHTPDIMVPFATIMELFCYLGWIKVAETLLNPFGDDDEDFQINFLIDRNLQVKNILRKTIQIFTIFEIWAKTITFTGIIHDS